MTDNEMESNHISSVCNGTRTSTDGYKWKWFDEFEKPQKVKKVIIKPIIK